MIQQLTEDNFLLYAIKHYDNPTCTGLRDLQNDLKRFKYLKRLFRRYAKTHKMTSPLVINHFIVLRNLFGEAFVPMVFFKIERKFWPQVKTFLVFLNLLPTNYLIKGKIHESEIPLDSNIIQQLRKI